MDPPRYPVNIAVTDQTQREVDVLIRGQRIRSRYVQHGSGPLVLFLHGLGSRLEESERVRALLSPRYTCVALDLLGHGCTQRIRPEALGIDAAQEPRWREESTFPFLQAQDEFVNSFIEAIGAKDDLRIVAGGSLGGTLTLRQAMRDQDERSKRRYLPWSPASCWESMQKFEPLRRGTEKRVGGRLRKPELRVWDLDSEPARADTRFDFVYFNFVERIPTIGPASNTWWSDAIGAALKAQYVWLARLDRRELLDDAMRLWNLGLAYEQTYFSFIERERGGVRRIDRIKRGTYVVVGDDDRAGQILAGTDIAGNVERLIGTTPLVPGWISIVPQTGHSIHDERPGTLALLIDDLYNAPTLSG
ncbi:MAG: alpha/beta fold hydrolase [Polyangiaceae bacterium]